MNIKMLSIFPLLLITSFVFALKTDVSSYWDKLAQKAKARLDNSYQKEELCKQKLMDTHGGTIYTAHENIFYICANLSLDRASSMRNICEKNDKKLVKALQKVKQYTDYETYKQSLKEYAYNQAFFFALDAISERHNLYYRDQWNKERAIKHANDRRPEKYNNRMEQSREKFLEESYWYPEYVKEDIERAITDVLNLIEEYDKIHNDNNTIQINI